MPTEGARELAEKIAQAIADASENAGKVSPGSHARFPWIGCDAISAIIEPFVAAFAASAVARESAEHEKALLAVIDERDTLESDIENIARELGCNEDATNLHSHSECAISAVMSVDDRIKAAVARERERCAEVVGMIFAEERLLIAIFGEDTELHAQFRDEVLDGINSGQTLLEHSEMRRVSNPEGKDA